MGHAKSLPDSKRRLTALNPAWILAAFISSATALAAQSSQPLDLLEQLNRITLDPGQVYSIRNAHLRRGPLDLHLNRGFIAFMTPVQGEITGAVFWGEGEVLMIPPNPVEKGSLARFTHAAILEENFNSLYLRFTDRSAQELLAACSKPDPDDPEQPGPVTEQWNSVAQPPSPESSIRILADILGDRSRPFFHARVNGQSLGVFEITDDERLPEPFSIAALQRIGPRTFTDIWCSFSPHPAQDSPREPANFPARALAYKLDVQIHLDHSLDGRAEVELESRSSRDRVISFDLSRWLSVTEVRDEKGREIPLIGAEVTGPNARAGRAYDHVDVVLPEAHPSGARYRLTFQYHGDVITDFGNGVLYVGARGTWYPNIGFGLPSSYDLTFHYPSKLVLVATGALIDEKTLAGETESRWRSDGVFRLAGFNLGAYTSVERAAENTRVTVYAAREAEAFLESRHEEERATPGVVPGTRQPIANPGHVEVTPLEPSALLGDVAATAAHSAQYFSTLFGPYPYPRLSITQAPGTFGQGWPELIYLPTLAFLPKSQRTEVDLNHAESDLEDSGIIAHEVAHQWWGNLLDGRTYHDQWLSEGLASYAAALFMAQGKDGHRKFHDLLRLYKRDLLAKTGGGANVESGGPIWLGQRLSSSIDPNGYTNIVYKKACWVLNMLHTVMTDPRTGSDARFFAMLRDFVAQYQGKSVSTEDFIRHAEKYMPQQNDLEPNRRLDWFFNEWVYSTGIPEYTLKADYRPLDRGRYEVRGTVTQSGVAEDFEMPVRLVAQYAGNKRALLGQVVVGANGGQFRFAVSTKPQRVVIDEDTVLAVVH